MIFVELLDSKRYNEIKAKELYFYRLNCYIINNSILF